MSMLFGGTRLLFSDGEGAGGAGAEGAGAGGAEGGDLPGYAPQLKKELRLPDLKEIGPDLNVLVTNARTWKRELAEAKAASDAGGFAIPTDKDPPEKVAAFRKAFGIPDAPDGYKLKLNLPAGAPADLIKPEELKEFSAAIHKLHVPQATAQALLDYETARAVAARAAYAKAKTEEAKQNLEAFRSQHKEKSKEMLVMIDRVIEFMGGKELREEFDQNMGNNPRLLAGLAKIAPLFNEKGVGAGGGQGEAGAPELDLAKVYPLSYNRMMGKAG
jgi:hypothetical protein